MKILLILFMLINTAGSLRLTTNMKRKYFDYIGYKPEPIQWQAHIAKTKFVAIRGGNRSGKTWFAGYEGAVDMQLPMQRIWCVGPTYDLSLKVYRLIYQYGVTPLQWPLAIDRQTPPQFETSVLTRVWGKSIEKLKSIEGEGINKMFCDEFGYYTKQDWERLLIRLDQENSQCYVIYTPRGKNPWTRQFWADKTKDKDNWTCLHMPTDECAHISKQFLEDAEREFGGKDSPAYRESIRAEFVPYGILVYPEFNEKNVRPVVANPKWRFAVGVDSGYVHACAATFWGVSKGDLCHQLGEYYQRYTTQQKNAYNIIQQVGELSKKIGIKPSRWRIFASPEEPGFIKELNTYGKQYGVRAFKANNDVESRLELTRQLLPTQIITDPACHYTIWEYHNYSHKQDSEVINKIHDDCQDSNGYALLGVFGRRRGKPKKSLY